MKSRPGSSAAAATGTRFQRASRGISGRSLAILGALLLCPLAAVVCLCARIDPRIVVGSICLTSGASFLLYRADKNRARTGGWRIRESTLLSLDLLGGWPGAFLAQRAYRHKISKRSYQARFWAVVIVHEWVAFDFTQGWKYSNMAIALLKA